MTNVSCGLTAKKLGSAPWPKLVIEYVTIFISVLMLFVCNALVVTYSDIELAVE